MEHNNWNGFKEGVWKDEINVRDFIQTNYKEYKGDASFLAGATERTEKLMKKLWKNMSLPKMRFCIFRKKAKPRLCWKITNISSAT